MSIQASCGCEVFSGNDLIPVIYADVDCDPIEGFMDVLIYSSYCPKCAQRLKDEGRALTEAQADKMFS